MAINPPRLFWPETIGPYEADLRNLLAHFQRLKDIREHLEVVEKHLHQLPSYPNARNERVRYRTYLLVLADLLRQLWRPEVHQGQLYLRPPDWTTKVIGESEIQERKRALRQSLIWERNAQFKKRSVQDFIHRMEQGHLFNGQPVSIRSLLAHGETLARQLQAVTEVSDEVTQRERVLAVIRPYLQLVTTGARCPYTGFYLQDIWRYFRYTWVTPYHSTPGRQMFYLVRDAAQPYHPVIGIAALGSSIVQLTVRDNVIGWTPSAMGKRLHSPSFDDTQAASVARMLRKTLRDALNDLDLADLVPAEELTHASSDAMRRLSTIETQSRSQRLALLRELHEQVHSKTSLRQLPENSSRNNMTRDVNTGPSRLRELAQVALYRAKRAGVLRQVLQAQRALDEAGNAVETAAGLRNLWESAAGQQAIRTLLRENKKRKIGANMMDIIICGAIPPYNVILGGKLVAMLLASPQIAFDYEKKYVGHSSTIASRMKGKDVRRDSRLVFLGTTSLYAHGSSQYNRIVVPVPGSTDVKMRYISYGLTEGYGSIHFSGETVAALSELQETVQGARLINNRFGEGVNPKLRRVRAGLNAIGLVSVNNFIRHRSQRVVYGLPLGLGSYSFLRGETSEPDYYITAGSEDERRAATSYISRFWATRWLLRRIQNNTFLSRVAAFQPENVLLSREFGAVSLDEPPV